MLNVELLTLLTPQDMPETSIIIRTKNEERWVGVVLQKLMDQTYRDFEIVIVDSGSTDSTLKIAKQFPVKILEIPSENFSYPYATNYGARHSVATKYLCMLSAHSLPISNTWLADGIESFDFSDRIVGVYAYPRAIPDGTFWDKLFQNTMKNLRDTVGKIIPLLGKRRWIVTEAEGGVLGFTNALIRKDLWEKRPLNEKYGAGGEDQEWATYWINQGYRAVYDKNFSVYHSHYLGFMGWIRQRRHWKSSGKSAPFKPLKYRNDPAHKQNNE